ncbi:MAG: YceI family protein [Patescibacteria group bacterium]
MHNTKLMFTVLLAVAFIGAGCTAAVQQNESDTNSAAETTQQQESTEKQMVMESSNPDALSANENDAQYQVNTEESSIQWTGYKIVPKSEHYGTINFESGELYVNEEGQVTEGRFVVDMSSIVNEDLENESMNERLVNHLKAEDFFDSAAHPTSELVFTNIAALEGREDGVTHQIAANLTIKGITHNITFPATISVENGVMSAQASVSFDRTRWDVQFGSLKFGPDAIVEDVITFDVALVASAQ